VSAAPVLVAPGEPRRIHPMESLPAAARAEQARRFDEATAERDGELDFVARTLSRREERQARLDRTLRWRGPFDREAFEHDLRGRRARTADARTLWIIAAARCNLAESWGVDVDIRRQIRRGVERIPLAERYILIEEQYHAKLLQEICRTLGVTLEPRRPMWLTRFCIHAISRLPVALRYVPLLCGEMLGVVTFRVLVERCDVFAAEPDVEAHVRGLMNEILEDEILHVAYCRSRLGPAGMALARRLVGPMAAGLMLDVPEFGQLGCDRAELQRRLHAGVEVPASLSWLAG
jgi:hypothetical protein